MPKQIARDVAGELLEIGKQTGKAVKQVVTGPPRSAKFPPDTLQAEEVKKMGQEDKQQSQQRYRQIQAELASLRRQRAGQPAKYEAGKPGFDEEQVKDPERFVEKMTEQQKMAEKQKKSLPLSVRQARGTREISRGKLG